VVGETVGSYRIVSKLGEGGMGVVYLGEHQRIARKTAIKVLLPDFSQNQDVVDRFFREAMATSRIKHPGIVEVIDCDLLPNGSAYIIMELLEGESLGAHLRRHGRLSVQRAVSIARQIADALAAAHDERIVHRDLKPDNVFVLSPKGGGAAQPIKVVDFGIAKLLNTESGQNNKATRTGSIIGTPVYMSPEQCRGTGQIDHRTDIYSLGCIVFELLTGRPPFTHEGFGELIQSHLGVVPPTIRSIDPAFPVALDGLVARMLAKDPGERPQTMRALAAELDAIAADAPAMTAPMPSLAPPPSATRLLPAERAKVATTLRSASGERVAVPSTEEHIAAARPRRTGAIVSAVAVVAAGIGLALFRAGSSTPERAAATTSAAPTPSSAPPSSPAPLALASPPVARTPATPPAVAPSPPEPARPATATAGPSSPLPGHVAAPTSKAKHVTKTAKAEMVHIKVVTVPSGAEVCLSSDRLLMGKTTFDWSTAKSSREVKLLIRKPGYRGQALSVTPDADNMQRIELEKLGPDALDDNVACKPR
jgi:serine/threonine-protein kinase